MKNKAAKSWQKNSRCVLTIFAALFIGVCATEAAKKPQAVANAASTPQRAHANMPMTNVGFVAGGRAE